MLTLKFSQFDKICHATYSFVFENHLKLPNLQAQDSSFELIPVKRHT